MEDLHHRKSPSTIRCVKLVGKKEFAAAAFDPEYEICVIHVGSVSSDTLPSSSLLDVHPSQRPQISGLITKEAPIKVLAKYSDFVNVFSPDLAFELPKHTEINNHAIQLVNGYQQPPYRPIYSLGPVELEKLKAYIETNLANGFIRPFKSAAGALIVFDRKSDSFLWLCVDYQGLNNLTIKNRYLLLLTRESLDRLERADRFTQLNLINAYHRIRIREGDE